MLGYAQPRTLPATTLLYLAAALRTAACRVRVAARRLDEWTDAGEAGTSIDCEACSEGKDDVHELDDLAGLNPHVLKDIGAPHSMIARAAGEAGREHLRWIELERS